MYGSMYVDVFVDVFVLWVLYAYCCSECTVCTVYACICILTVSIYKCNDICFSICCLETYIQMR